MQYAKNWLSLYWMKKMWTYPIVLIIAALVFWSGSGMYVPSFCCDRCQSAGIEGIAEDLCCEIHHHDHEAKHHPKSDMDSIGDADEMCCFLTHIIYDWTALDTSIVSPEPVVYDLMATTIPNCLVVSSPGMEGKTLRNSCGPPFLSPRTHLLLLTTLLI